MSELEIAPLCSETKRDSEGVCLKCKRRDDDLAVGDLNSEIVDLLLRTVRKHCRFLWQKSCQYNLDGAWVVSADSLFEAIHDMSIAFTPAEVIYTQESEDNIVDLKRCLDTYDRASDIVVWVRVFDYHVLETRPGDAAASDDETESGDEAIYEGNEEDDDELANGDDGPMRLKSVRTKPGGLDEEIDLGAAEQEPRQCHQRAVTLKVMKLLEIKAPGVL